MKKSALFSALFHGILLLILLIGIPMPQRQNPVIEQPIMMEFEKIGPIRKAPVLTPKASLEDKPKKTPTPPKKIETPKEESVPEEKPEEKIEAQPKIEEKKKEEPKPEKIEKKDPKKEKTDAIPEKPKKKEPPKKEEKKKEPTKTPEKAVVDLSKKKKDQSSKKTDDKKIKEKKNPKQSSVDDILNDVLSDALVEDLLGEGSTKGAPAQEVGDAITATDIDAIRQKIHKCWIVPLGGKEARDMIVDIVMDIGPDGTVTKAEVIDGKSGDPAFQAAAESAQRAVLDPVCNPLPLPADKYEQWKRLRLRFNPKDMY